MTPPSEQSVLIIGATGRTGLECLRQLASRDNAPRVHVFCRDSKKIPAKEKALCASVIEADARSSKDLERAIKQSRATLIIVSIGNGDSVAKSDIRTASAQALVSVLQSQSEYQRIKIIVVSSTGAGSSRIVVGMGIGRLIEFHLRHVLKDHTGQEAAFDKLRNRTVVVRATFLTDNEPTGQLVVFGDKEKSPSIKTDRADLANWIADAVCSDTPVGKVVNVTGLKQ